MGQIKVEHQELFALEFRKIAESNFVYPLASTNINKLATNLVKMYVTIRSPIRVIIDLKEPELSELFAKIAESDCVHPSIYKCRPISTKHGHNIYDNEVLDKFDYGSYPTVTSGVICP